MRCLVLLAAALLLCPVSAFAQDCYSSSVNSGAECPDEGEAYAVVRQKANEFVANFNADPGNTAKAALCPEVVFENWVAGVDWVNIRIAIHRPGVDACPNGVITAYRKYRKGNDCSARQPVYQGWYQGSPAACISGCAYGPGPKMEDWRIVDSRNAVNGINVARGTLTPTGSPCSAATPEPPPPPVKDDYCALLDGGYKVCRNSRDQQCVVSGKTGRKYCAGPEGTNATNPDRTENVSIGPKSPAPGTPPTSPTPRPAEEWTKDRTVTSTNTVNNTTQITNINNNAGTPNTNPGTGTPGDGSENPGTGEGEGEGDGDEGSTVGGGACDVGYTCTGGDAALCAILKEQHQQRCAGDKSTEQLKADAGQGVEEGGTTPGDFFIDGEMPTLDTMRFSMPAGELFPQVEIDGQMFQVPQAFYTVIDAIKAIIIAVATIYARFILGK